MLTNSQWRHTFTGGADIEVTFRGSRPSHAALIDDAAQAPRSCVHLRSGVRAIQNQGLLS